MSSSPLTLECRINRNYLRVERKAVVFLSAEVQTKEARELSEAGASNIINVCMAIDCSSSMSGEKFETAKKAAIQIVDLLKPTDYVSVVRFADEANVVIPRQKVANKGEIQQRIQSMKLGSTTALYDGIKKSHKELLGGTLDSATELISTTGIVGGFKKLLGRKPEIGRAHV